jgi:hypothetical protein
MLYRFDYTTRNEKVTSQKYVDFAGDSVEATKVFMNGFFADNPGDAVRIEKITEIEFTGDMSQLGEVLRGTA